MKLDGEKQYLIGEKLVNVLIGYMTEQKYKEVAHLIQATSQLMPLEVYIEKERLVQKLPEIDEKELLKK